MYNVFGSVFSGKVNKLKEMLDFLDSDNGLDKQLEQGKKEGFPIEEK